MADNSESLIQPLIDLLQWILEGRSLRRALAIIFAIIALGVTLFLGIAVATENSVGVAWWIAGILVILISSVVSLGLLITE